MAWGREKQPARTWFCPSRTRRRIFLLGFDGLGGGELAGRYALLPLDDLKFPGGQAGIKIGANLGIGDLAHAAAEPIADQGAFIYDGLALEVLVAGKGERFPDTVNRVHGLLLMLKPLARRADNGIGLVAEVGGELAMRGHDLAWRMDFFPVAGRVRGDLGGFFSRCGRCARGTRESAGCGDWMRRGTPACSP